MMKFELKELFTHFIVLNADCKMPIPCPYGRQNVDLSGKRLPLIEKLWFVQQLKESKLTPTTIHKKYKISINTSKSWLQRDKNRGYLCPEIGRPPLISKEVQEKVVVAIRNSRYKLPQSTVHAFVEELRSDEAVASGKSPNSLNTVSKKTLKRYHNQMGLQIKYAESTTEARAKATTSVRNAMSFHAMTRYASEVLEVNCAEVINSDGSSFTVGATNKECTKCVVLKTERGSGETKVKDEYNQFITPKGETLFDLYTVKVYLMISAMGTVFDPVYIIQDETRKADDFDVYPEHGKYEQWLHSLHEKSGGKPSVLSLDCDGLCV